MSPLGWLGRFLGIKCAWCKHSLPGHHQWCEFYPKKLCRECGWDTSLSNHASECKYYKKASDNVVPIRPTDKNPGD